jgi:hypothetical protein
MFDIAMQQRFTTFPLDSVRCGLRPVFTTVLSASESVYVEAQRPSERIVAHS